MPDGTRGRGFVGPLTWSFLGGSVNEVGDESMLTAYAGWAWLTASIERGMVQTNFAPGRDREALLDRLYEEGLEDVETGDSYKIGSSEIYEFRAIRGDAPVCGAASVESALIQNLDQPECTAFPAVYLFLGA